MIAPLGNRPVLLIGTHQVFDYDGEWIDQALLRAAREAGHDDFPFASDIRDGVMCYLESKCPLRLLPVGELSARVRRMLVRIGWESVAERLEALAPPLTVSLIRTAQEAGDGYELAFFNKLREELQCLRTAGAAELRFTGLRECVLALAGNQRWNRRCDALLAEVRDFLAAWDRCPSKPGT